MAIIGFKKYSVGKIYILTIKNIYLELYEKYLNKEKKVVRFFISVYFFLYVIIYTPKLLIKICKQQNEINKKLEKKFIDRIFELLFDIKKVFPELSDENAEFFSNGLGYGFMHLMLNEIFPKFQMVSERLLENGWFINNYRGTRLGSYQILKI